MRISFSFCRIFLSTVRNPITIGLFLICFYNLEWGKVCLFFGIFFCFVKSKKKGLSAFAKSISAKKSFIDTDFTSDI